jgi:hypothetical protein
VVRPEGLFSPTPGGGLAPANKVQVKMIAELGCGLQADSPFATNETIDDRLGYPSGLGDSVFRASVLDRLSQFLDDIQAVRRRMRFTAV